MSGRVLVAYARAHLRQELGGAPASPPSGDGYEEPRGTFVTLRWTDGSLHGCIGSLEPRRPLVEDVAHHVVAAATLDPRSEPVVLADVDDLDVELSILSPLEPITFDDEASALAAIRRGIDGIVLEWRGRRATFLPSMWPRIPDAKEFVAHIKTKAGLPPDFWDEDVRLFRYTVDKHEDKAARRVS